MAGRGEGKGKSVNMMVKPEIRGPKVLFGEANCDGVEEVKQPLRRSSGDLASDEILCIADSANQLPHQRHCCLKHAFGSGNNHVFANRAIALFVTRRLQDALNGIFIATHPPLQDGSRNVGCG